MLFERVAIIGTGLIGGSIGLAIKQRGLVGRVTGVARTQATLDRALVVGAADDVTRDPAEAVADADLVYLATPVDAMTAIFESIAPHLPDGCLVTDGGSTKRQVLEAASVLPPGVDFVGGHPLAGSEQSGPSAASSELFAGTCYFLTPVATTDASALARMRELVEGIGARPVEIDPVGHDRMLASTSHLPHLVAAALCNAVAQLPDLSQFAGTGFRDATRIAAGQPEMWRDILLSNADEVGASLASLRERLRGWEAALAQADGDALMELLDRARKVRERMVEPCDR